MENILSFLKNVCEAPRVFCVSPVVVIFSLTRQQKQDTETLHDYRQTCRLCGLSQIFWQM